MSRGRDVFDAILKTLSRDPETEFGAAGAIVEIVGSVDGPFSRVRRVRIDTAGRTVHAYIKVLTPRRTGADELERLGRMLDREYHATQALYDALRPDDELGAVRPIARLPEHLAIVTEEVPGRPLSALLAEATAASPELCGIARRVGRWIRAYQRLGAPGDPIAPTTRREYVDARLARLEGRVLSAADRRAVLSRLDALTAELGGDAVPAVPIHADLSPLNLIVDDSGRVTVLDFTMAKTGAEHHDLSHVYFHLELLAARHFTRRPMVRALQGAMLDGFDPALNASHPLFRLLLLQHAVCHVALLAERRIPVVDLAYRWFVKRRWQICERMIDGPAALRVA